jgi:hypothetical protein
MEMDWTWYDPFMSVKRWFRMSFLWMRGILIGIVFLFLASQSTVPMRGTVELVRRYTSHDEFEFAGWTLGALGAKIGQFSLGTSRFLTDAERKSLVIGYFDDLNQVHYLEQQLEEMVADPERSDQEQGEGTLREQLSELRLVVDQNQPVVESIIQEQVTVVLADLGLGLGGKIFPPVAFKFTQLPLALIVSPREVIRQDANIQLNPNLTLDQRISLEEQVDRELNVSSLVVNIGGIGIYPTMVVESGSMSWVIETVAHEWVHNYLTLRPLGLNYETTPELRTMNETVASLLGVEIGRRVFERYYPELLSPEEESQTAIPSSSNEPPAFEFRAEMHETRVAVDSLLAEGKVEEAEAYMEDRRQVFWDNGYRLRKINQAYFAFHGAYADQAQGPAGEDPVGEAVRELWSLSDSPVQFLRRMAWMNDFSDLEAALQELVTTP